MEYKLNKRIWKNFMIDIRADIRISEHMFDKLDHRDPFGRRVFVTESTCAVVCNDELSRNEQIQNQHIMTHFKRLHRAFIARIWIENIPWSRHVLNFTRMDILQEKTLLRWCSERPTGFSSSRYSEQVDNFVELTERRVLCVKLIRGYETRLCTWIAG